MEKFDAVIIGGGVIGLSTAYNLLQRHREMKVLVLEKEMFLGTGATAACTGGLRHQFSTRSNIELTLLSMPAFKRFEDEMEYPIHFLQHGYLFVTGQSGRWEIFRQDAALQQSLGVPTELLSPEELARRFPYLATKDLVGGSFCTQDGYADPHGVVQGYAQQIRRLGGIIRTDHEVTGIKTAGGRVTGVTTPADNIAACIVVNAAGPFAGQVAALAGVHLPIQPYRRQVFVAAPIPGLPEGMPLTVDMDTGWYVHRETKGFLLLGGTDKDLAPGFDTAVDWSGFDRVAEAALQRIPLMENCQITKAYAGLRDMTPDMQAILGETAEIKGFYCAAGFTGHGFMHAPAIGMLIAELISRGTTTAMDITPLSPARFAGTLSAVETNIF